LQNKRPDLNAEPSSALQDQAFANELVDASPAKATTAEVSSLKSLAVVDPEPALYSANETTAPQSSMPQDPNKTQGGSVAGWWVILGSINVGEADSAMTMVATGVRRASSAAHRCGMGTFNDVSSKFRGFAPGYMVVVIGPFAEKADAARSQQRVNGCISGSFVKYAQHLGE
jgi:cell division septation protein DedD